MTFFCHCRIEHACSNLSPWPPVKAPLVVVSGAAMNNSQLPAAAASAGAPAAPAAAPRSPLLTKDVRDNGLQFLLEFFTSNVADLHKRTKEIEEALRTKGESMGMQNQATAYEEQDAARRTLASGAAGGTAAEGAAAVSQDGWRCVCARSGLSAFPLTATVCAAQPPRGAPAPSEGRPRGAPERDDGVHRCHRGMLGSGASPGAAPVGVRRRAPHQVAHPRRPQRQQQQRRRQRLGLLGVSRGVGQPPPPE